MRNYIIKSLVIFGLIYAFVVSVIIVMFSWYNYSFEKDYASDLGYQQHEIYLNNLDKKYNEDYAYFSLLIENNSLTDLNNNLESYNNRDLILKGFYEVSDVGITINNQTFLFKDKLLFERNFNSHLSFFSLSDILVDNNDETLYGVFIKEQTLALFDAQTYMDNLLPLNAFNAMIIRENGFILKSYDELNVRLLSDYVQSSTTQLFNDEISKGKNGKTWVNVLNDSTLLSYAKVSDLPIYYVSFYKEKDLVVSFSNVNLYLTSSLIAIGCAFVLGNLLTFYTSFVRFTDIENARLKVYFNTRLIVRVNNKGKVIGINRGFRKVILNHKKYKKISDFKITQFFDDKELIEKIKRGFSFTAQLDTLDGSSFVKFIPLRMGINYILVGDNLTKDDMLLREYESMALINNVTKLPNYNFYQAYIKELLEKSDFNKTKHYVVVMNILDFKSINKLVGEKVANQTLIDFVETLKNALTNFNYELINNYVDNFILVLNDVESLEKVELWLEGLIIYLEASSNLSTSTLQLNLRAGIYEINQVSTDELNPDIIFDRASIALKNANQSTTSKYAVYDVTLRDSVTQRQRLEQSLIEAIDKKEFVMYLQPQVDTNKNKIVSFEALIRWNNPRYHHISPQDFIRLAEENNLIVNIGQIVMEETAKIAKKLEKYNVTIAMNISPVQMIQKGFVNSVKDVLEKYEINPHSIALEITETFMVNSMQLMSEKLRLLQKLGIDIHLDDFGMGYSSLVYLKDLPIDMIKIDKKFIDQITSDKYSKAIVNMIVSLSKAIGVDIIAEGVETEAQKAVLTKSGVSIIQGWLFSKAVPFDEAVLLLENFNESKKK